MLFRSGAGCTQKAEARDAKRSLSLATRCNDKRLRIGTSATCKQALEPPCADTMVRDATALAYGPNDGGVVATLAVTLADLRLPASNGEPVIVNVCGQDCVNTPRSGFLVVDVLSTEDRRTDTFTLSLMNGAARNGRTSWPLVPQVIGNGQAIASTPLTTMAPATYGLSAIIPPGWRATSLSCTADAVPVGTTLQNIVVRAGQVTRCKIVVDHGAPQDPVIVRRTSVETTSGTTTHVAVKIGRAHV